MNEYFKDNSKVLSQALITLYIYNTFLVLANKAGMFLKHINQYMKFKEKNLNIVNI